MEIYNERIFDLLADLANPDQAADYTIAEEKDGRGTFVRGLTEISISSETEALNLLFGGELSRTTATHKLNRRSNRSHSLFTIYLQQRQRSGVSERIVHSKLHLVDLAGSERLKKTMDSIDGKMGDEVTRKESMSINQSLTFLEQCVVALARRGQSHVPYRQSKLTNILKDCLGANCNTLMIACMWGEADHLEETISTLRLASRMMKVQNETSMVETIDSSALIKKQAKLIKALKQELLMHDALVERTGVGYEPFTPEQQSNVYQMLERYIAAKEIDEEEVLHIDSFRQMLEVCKQFKKMVLAARAEAESAQATASTGLGMGSDGFGATGRPASQADYGGFGAGGLDSRIADGFDPHMPAVGEASNSGKGGFILGVSDAESRPAVAIDGILRSDRAAAGLVASPAKSTSSPGRRGQRSGHVDFDMDSPSKASVDLGDGSQSALFSSFIREQGIDLYQDFVQAKAYVKELRQKVREGCTFVNDSKANIDRLQREVEDRKQSRIELLRKSGLKTSDTEDIVDEDEFRLMKKLREAKATYKNGYEQLQKLKVSVLQAQLSADAVKSQLTTQFSAWNAGNGGGGKDRRFGATATAENGSDQLDDQEAFDRLEEERVLANDPDSLAYFHAQKTRRALMTQNQGSLQQIRKNKRFH